MIPTGFSPVMRPVAKAPAIKFQADASSAEEKLSRKLDALAQAIEQNQVQLVAKKADGDFTVRINGELYNVGGLGKPRYGTMPEQLSLEKLVTGETVDYIGPGCFSIASVGYRESVAEAFSERLYGEVAYKAANVIRDLGKLAGIVNRNEE